MGSAIFQGDTYLHSLRDSLKQIKTDEENLKEEAGRSFQWKTMQDLQQVKQVLSMGARQNVFLLLNSHAAERDISKTPFGGDSLEDL